MADWKKIRDKDAEYESQISHDIDDEKSNKAFAAQNGHRNRSFPSLITALEEREAELERARKEIQSYQREAESARRSHAVAELTANERKKRIEFLEKALEQAIDVANIEHGVTSVSVSVDVPKSFVSDGSGSVENLFPSEAFPELAKYLEEKNG